MATAATVFRDYETDGVPASGSHKVKKNDVRGLLAGYEAIINAFTSNGGLIYSSKASLDGDLAHPVFTMAWVVGDATVANNGIYKKIGASGTGSWTRVADLPFSFIIASDVGAGTANAIQATTSIPVSSSALVWMNIFEANTASPVTVSFNGGSALTIKTNAGNDVSAGGLTSGMIVLGIISGSTFRLVSDQASAAVLAACEAAKAAAEAAAASMVFKQSETPQSGGGTYTTYDRPAARVVQEIISIYDAIPEAERADIRTGLRSTSCTAFFEKMVNLMNPGGTNIPGGAKIHIPRGKYLIDGTGIPLQDSIEWEGENKEGTRIQAMGNNPIFKSVGTSANQVGRAAVRNMTLVGAGKTHLSGYGIELVWMNNPLIEDVQFQALRWCIVQEYVVNAFIFGCSSNGSANTIRGYLWKKAIDSINFSGFDNTTTISDCYFMAGDLAMVLHGSNGIQMGGNVAMLQGGIKVGAFEEQLADGALFTPGANNDVIHFQHWDGLRLDTVTNDRAIRILKGAMAAPHDIRINSLWAGNVTGSNSYVCDFDGVEDFSITCFNIDTTGQTPFWFNNCKRGVVSSGTVRMFGGNSSQNAVLIQNSEGIGVIGNEFNVHTSATAADGVRAESSSRIRAQGNDFDFRSIAPTGSTARRSVLVDTTGSVVADNTANDLASYPCVESGTSNYNRVHDNPSSVTPTIVGANSGAHDNTGGGYLTATTTYDPPSLADGTGAQTNVVCSGAALGDFAVASFSISTSSLTVTATVTAANQVTVRFQNESGSTIDLASGTLAVRVFKQ